MLQIIGYMITAYGIARLLQTTAGDDNRDFQRIAGWLGIVALAVLGAMLTQQANGIGSTLGSFP